MILVGWKQIAQYLGIGVRTAQRWELLGLPVRRPRSRLRSAVLVDTDDIKAWVSQCSDGRNPLNPRGPAVTPNLQVDPLSERMRGRMVDQLEIVLPKHEQTIRTERRKSPL